MHRPDYVWWTVEPYMVTIHCNWCGRGSQYYDRLGVDRARREWLWEHHWTIPCLPEPPLLTDGSER